MAPGRACPRARAARRPSPRCRSAPRRAPTRARRARTAPRHQLPPKVTAMALKTVGRDVLAAVGRGADVPAVWHLGVLALAPGQRFARAHVADRPLGEPPQLPGDPAGHVVLFKPREPTGLRIAGRLRLHRD